MLRSIGEQSGKSVESLKPIFVCSRYLCLFVCHFGRFGLV